jgi:hypothetical protein
MKIFCIGHAKTGTTSMAQALRSLGFKVGSPLEAGRLLGDWQMRDFRRLIEYCKSADVFQDIPFALGYTFQAVDAAYPNSKFILTVRDSPEQWYESLTNFHSKVVGASSVPPRADDLKKFKGGWILDSLKLIFDVDESNLYDREIYKQHYVNHNSMVMDYFKFRPDDLLILNLATPDAMKRLCEYLNIKYSGQKMPHANKTITTRSRL